jgi:hypothetical protein
MKGWRAQETMNDALTAEKRRYRDRWKKETSQIPMQLFLPCMSDIPPCRIGLCFMTLLVLCSITRSSWSSNSIGCSEWKRILPNSNVNDFLKFQAGSIICAIEDYILLYDRTRWIHEIVVEIALTWHRNEQHYLGYWIDLDDSRVPLRHQVGYKKALVKPQWYGWMIDVNQGVHSVGSGWYIDNT